MTREKPFASMPELCKHFDIAECTEECHEKARKFDEWLRGKLREGNDDVSTDPEAPPVD